MIPALSITMSIGRAEARKRSAKDELFNGQRPLGVPAPGSIPGDLRHPR
jgi:hypothetical protein